MAGFMNRVERLAHAWNSSGSTDILEHSWNAFEEDQEIGRSKGYYELGAGSGYRPDRLRTRVTHEKSMVTSVYMRIGIDCAAVDMRHVKVDEDGQYLETMKSGLNNCLTVEANLDQAASHFKKDMVWTLLNEGYMAIVPIDTSISPVTSGGYDIKTLRVGRIVEWKRRHVRVSVFNEELGARQDILVPKKYCAIVENPLYEVMNEPNSILQRLVRKLSLLDTADEQNTSGKLDLIIQLPHTIRSDARRIQAEQRVKDIEFQLSRNTHGIAYADGTEKIVQLNRPVENKLPEQIADLVEMLYGQLGTTPEVMNGTADEATMINYYNRTVEPILRAISEAMIRTFLTSTARTQGQTVGYWRDPFRLVPLAVLAEIVDKFSRNEILSGNEIRGAIGFKPSKDPKANELRNSNVPAPEPSAPTEGGDVSAVNAAYDEVESLLSELEKSLEVAA